MRLYKPLETPGANWAAVTSVTIIAQQVAGKAARDALFLSSFHVSNLPLVMAAAAVLSLVAVFGLSRLVSERSPAAVLPLLLGISGAAFASEWALSFNFPRVAAVLVYFHTALFGPALLTTFWSLINERFDPHTAKRAVARIAGGGTLGGVLGGLMAWRASTLVSLPTLLLLLAGLNVTGIVGTLLTAVRRDKIAPTHAPTSTPPPSLRPSNAPPDLNPLAQLAQAPFLRNLAILVGVGAVISSLLDYVFSVQASAVYAKGQPLLTYFSLFWLAVSVLSFLLQVSLGRFALEKLGLAVNIAVLPGIIVMGGAIGLAVPGLVSSALLRGAEAVQRNTLFRSAYELLYTPLSETQKRSTKAVIDVGFDRLGTVLGSGICFVAIHAFMRHTSAVLLGSVVVLGLVTFPLVRMLHVGYVAALEASLRDGAKKIEAAGGDDPGRPTLEGHDRDKLIERVEAIQPGGLTALLDADARGDDDAPASREERARAESPAQVALRDGDAALVDAIALLSGDAAKIEPALAALSPYGPAVPCAIFLLADPTFHNRALEALRRHAAIVTGQLVDALLDGTRDFVLRRRIPRVLAAAPSQRAADGLLLGLADERFEVRYQCGRALLAITEKAPDVVIAREKVIAVVQREIDLGRKTLEKARSEDFDDEMNGGEQSALMATLVRDRVDRSLEHLFTILSLHLEREPLRMAFRALHNADARHRGTALEYLETVLPAEVRDLIWPYLGEDALLPSTRAAKEILADLATVPEDGERPSSGVDP